MGTSLFNGRFNIGVVVQDNNLDYAPSSFSFLMKDSIHDLYPTGSITFRDISGQFNEYLTFVNGVKVEITYGLSDKTITCPYIVARNSTPEQITKTNAGGIIEIPLIHRYYSTQNKISAAYKDEISNIIKNKIDKSNFKSINIDTTINKGIWYQPLLNDAEFMIKNLLPFAYSSNSQKSPFFLFIDSDNNFYFKSYKTLFIDENSVSTMKLLPSVTLDSISDDVILSFNSTQQSITKMYNTLHRLLFDFDSSGVYSDFTDKISDYPSGRNSQIPIPITWNLSNITEVIEQLPSDVKLENTDNNNSGYLVHTMRDGFFIDRAIIVVNLNINLLSGKKITINVPVNTDTTHTDTSQRFSGEYLIETSYHKWTGSLGKTILVCSRQEVKVPNSYTRQSILIKR